MAKREKKQPAAHAKPERTRTVEHSPFAALKDLREALIAKNRPEGR